MATRASKRRGFSPLRSAELLRLTFHGAAGEVTGSAFLLETRGGSVLVECGLFQGGRDAAARNRRPFPFDPRGVDAVLLTHAHIDHTGLLPRLVREGFHGPVHATPATCDLLGILLPDAAHIHEQDAQRVSLRRERRRGSGSRLLEPLYTTADAERALGRLSPVPEDQPFKLVDGVSARLRRNGHILGAASAELQVADAGDTRTLVFSGDVGRAADPLLLDPDPPRRADLCLLESTYGDRDHKDLAASLEELAQVLDQAGRAGENVIAPVFAVGRAQELLYYIGRLEREGRIAPRPVYLDSPMAIRVTELYARHPALLAPAIRAELARGDGGLDPRELAFCRTPEESMALNARRGVVILAASGMCEAGRVVHHLRHNLWRPEAHVLIVGFQAQGTTGRALVDGARSVRLLGESIAVRARIHTVGGLSAHAGQSELAAFADPMLAGGAELVLVHGEPEKRAALARRLAGAAKAGIHLPQAGDSVVLPPRGRGIWGA